VTVRRAPGFIALVQRPNVFVQPVCDLPPTRTVADHIVVLGDAAGTARPRTASGTSKEFGDAAMLARALTGWTPPDPLPAGNLRDWETARLTHLVNVARTGIGLPRNLDSARLSPLQAVQALRLRPRAVEQQLRIVIKHRLWEHLSRQRHHCRTVPLGVRSVARKCLRISDRPTCRNGVVRFVVHLLNG
jgi:2-polyprenyl-6-methoxyphenol hydroxylase-like FAD-dependent oxidoreductase